MPRVKKIFINQHRDTPESRRKGMDVVVFVNVEGVFYCDLPAGMRLPLLNTFARSELVENKDKGTVRVFADTLEALEGGVQRAFYKFTKPTVKEEPVICYNIESHVSFATDEDGNIFPSAGHPGAEWRSKENGEMYGDHNSANLCRGGYSLTVGAEARLKTTYSYGGHDKIKYALYYRGGDHFGRENPAERLNDWCSITLRDGFKEIPYSDEAAEFFYNLMYGIAKMAQVIQNHTFEQEKLLALIHSGNLLMPGTAPEEAADEI